MDREDKFKVILAITIIIGFSLLFYFLYDFIFSIANNITANDTIINSGNVAIVIKHANSY